MLTEDESKELEDILIAKAELLKEIKSWRTNMHYLNIRMDRITKQIRIRKESE